MNKVKEYGRTNIEHRVRAEATTELFLLHLDLLLKKGEGAISSIKENFYYLKFLLSESIMHCPSIHPSWCTHSLLKTGAVRKAEIAAALSQTHLVMKELFISQGPVGNKRDFF